MPSTLWRVSGASQPNAHLDGDGGLSGDHAEEHVHAAGAEVLDGVIVEGEPGPALASQDAAQLPARGSAPIAHTAAVAASGFVAGAALVGLVHHARRKRVAAGFASASPRTRLGAPRAAAGGAARELVQILGSRSLLLDVHLLAGPEKHR